MRILGSSYPNHLFRYKRRKSMFHVSSQYVIIPLFSMEMVQRFFIWFLRSHFLLVFRGCVDSLMNTWFLRTFLVDSLGLLPRIAFSSFVCMVLEDVLFISGDYFSIRVCLFIHFRSSDVSFFQSNLFLPLMNFHRFLSDPSWIFDNSPVVQENFDISAFRNGIFRVRTYLAGFWS